MLCRLSFVKDITQAWIVGVVGQILSWYCWQHWYCAV